MKLMLLMAFLGLALPARAQAEKPAPISEKAAIDSKVKFGPFSPYPIPPDHYESLSILMLNLQAKQIAVKVAEDEASKIIQKAQEEEQAAVKGWMAALAKEQKDAGASDRCGIQFDKVWKCPPPDVVAPKP